MLKIAKPAALNKFTLGYTDFQNKFFTEII